MKTQSIVPVNRRLLVSVGKVKEDKTDSGFILPKDFNKDDSAHERVVILAVAADCNSQFKDSVGQEAIVEKTMVETLHLGHREINIVLENYVVALLSRENNET